MSSFIVQLQQLLVRGRGVLECSWPQSFPTAVPESRCYYRVLAVHSGSYTIEQYFIVKGLS
jgi:hypothetical protein